MGKIIATCGHDITDEWISWFSVEHGDVKSPMEINVKELSGQCKKCIGIITACSDCRIELEQYGIILHNQDEITAWLNAPVLDGEYIW